jgi:hypothetical protein
MNCKLTVRHFISALFSVAFLAACQNAPDQLEEGSSTEGAAALSQILPGTWENVSMKVNVYSANNVADSSYVFQINDGDWENLFTVLPPRTYFETDNKYRIEYRDRRDSIISTSRGVWNVMGDTLMMIEKDQTMQGKIKYDKGLLYFIGLRDWDEDGQEDDAYLEVKRRVSIGTEK